MASVKEQGIHMSAFPCETMCVQAFNHCAAFN